MEQIIPKYYHQFQCIAGACPDSCCKEWAVDVDADTAAYYRSLEGALGDRLRAVLTDTGDGTVMEIENGRCPMWRQDGLCCIQAELGHDALCHVCQTFPRLRHDYGEVVELGLELSCPEAARLILSAETDAVDTQQVPSGEPATDPEALAVLRRSRDVALAFLESGAYPLPQTLAVLLLYGHNVQEELDGGAPASLNPEELLAMAKGFAESSDIGRIFAFMAEMEILTDSWDKLLKEGPSLPVWSTTLRRFVRYMIRRYWLQAIADYDIVCRVKFIVASCLLLGHLPGDPVATAQLFSKEIENDPDNVETILNGAYSAPALTDLHLLSLLLTP